MLRNGREAILQWSNRRRLPWLLTAAALMFTSAYSIGRFFAAIASVGALTGLPQYAPEIPRIRARAGWWELLAIVLPFLAAFTLGFGAASSAASGGGAQGSLTYPAQAAAEKWTAPFIRYLVRLVLSVLGTFGFLLLLLLVGFVFYKLRLHAG